MMQNIFEFMFHTCVLINYKAYSHVGMCQKRSRLIPEQIFESTSEQMYTVNVKIIIIKMVRMEFKNN